MISAAVLALLLGAEPFDCAELDADLARFEARERRLMEEAGLTPRLDDLFKPVPSSEIDVNKHTLAKYAEYLCTEENPRPCDGNHPMVGIVTNLWRWKTGRINVSQFAVALISTDQGAYHLYRLFSLFHERGTNLAPAFSKRVFLDPTLDVITPVFDAVGPDTPQIAELAAQLIEESDGDSGEWTAVEIVRILAERPEIIAPHLERWNRVSGHISSGLAFFGDDVEVNRIRAHWNEAPDSPARKSVLGWLAEADQEKADFDSKYN